MNKVIYLITTYKCSACKCQEYFIQKMLNEYKDIEFKILDCCDIPYWLQTKLSLTDFPTTIFVEDNDVKSYFVGTKSIRKMKALMKEINFN